MTRRRPGTVALDLAVTAESLTPNSSDDPGRGRVHVVTDLPRQMVKVASRDPEHICERLTLQAVPGSPSRRSSGRRQREPLTPTATWGTW